MDGRFTLSDGKPASHHMNYESFSKHFLNVFDEVVVVGRLFNIEDETAEPVVGPNVKFIAIPQYSGPKQFIFKILSILKILNKLSNDNSAFILRVPGTIPSLFCMFAFIKRKKYAIQCVADPADQLGEGSVKHPLRKLFRFFFIIILKWQCKTADISMYVTSKSLQKSYPPQQGKPTYNYTDLVLSDSSYIKVPRTKDSFNIKNPVLINVGMMVQLYKGQDVLIKAVKQCIDSGLNVSVKLIGDGEFRKYLEQLAEDLGIKCNVEFVGKVTGGENIIKYIDCCDMFVLPSRQEGLPRALMEAMARGMPCLGTKVGGIPELLDERFLVDPGDHVSLAELIIDSFSDVSKLHYMSNKNLNRSYQYHFNKMIEKRKKYYSKVKELYC
jgi:glycosyltransferase involved in cell wall biosynthesis